MTILAQTKCLHIVLKGGVITAEEAVPQHYSPKTAFLFSGAPVLINLLGAWKSP